MLQLHADGAVAVRLICPSSHGKLCKGTLKLSYKGHRLGKKAFAIKGGHGKTLVIKLRPRDRAVVASHRKGIKVKVKAGTTSTTKVLRKA